MDSSKSVIKTLDIHRDVIDQANMNKLYILNNPHVIKIVKNFVSLCKPSKVTVITDAEDDIAYVREKCIEIGEERNLKTEGHTIHFDGFVSMKYHDQARDKENTRILVPKGEYASPWINTIDREEGLNEVLTIMDGCMEGHECLVRFFCLGPKDSKFSILALQLTDSFYVAHSEDLLYRKGYEEFKKLKGSDEFFYFIHSSGELTGDPPVTKNLDDRRIYVDLKENRVLSVNNQYAGNSLGLKKLALRLAINKSNNEDWLAEHYFILGVHPHGKDRVSYFTGAYPSGCGKTSTAMLPEQTIVGDDIAYLRLWEDGYAHAVNIERGVFGIIKDVNPKDDPVIWNTITTPKEVIFSNVLIHEGKPYWIGDGREIPPEGFNFSGKWRIGKKDKNGVEIPQAHPNARYTVRIEELENADPNLHNPDGVPVHGIFYGGRDSDTMPPVLESLNWDHGVFLGAAIESETTAQTLGKVGIRNSSPMANLDFIVVPLSKYLENHTKFGNSLENPPKVFSTNYFLKDENGKYLNGMLDKLVWVMWAEGRAHGEFEAIKTPVGYIPYYQDLKKLFTEYLDENYAESDYIEQFSIRTTKLLHKLDRIEAIFKNEPHTPQFFWDLLNGQRERLQQLINDKNKEIISPTELS
ncbi:MAG: phosphoenolpyruvate carboxykinase (GTP) [Candidatus Lokiarchaeota archaeon]|nr:phosphoenolpyruvate carboxykinase (GTP) [Candidatus Lokiarchaeota archaeon]MBD3343230.1 phosphoenolpyruvate carboxykinase (GTP) [Candidatus Lokiarchaeota archaeon]